MIKIPDHSNSKPSPPVESRLSLGLDVIMGFWRFQKGWCQLWVVTVTHLFLQRALLIDLELIQREKETAKEKQKAYFWQKRIWWRTNMNHEHVGKKTTNFYSSVKVKNFRCKTTDEISLPLCLTIFICTATDSLIFFKTGNLATLLRE